MINFNFIKKEKVIDIDVDISLDDLTEIKNKAELKTNAEFNKNVISIIKDVLYEKYNIKDKIFIYNYPILYLPEKLILDAIINDIAKQLKLLK